MIERIVSGGQTGADQGGLDGAIRAGVPHGGWCPAGRRSEDGPIPDRYQLQEHSEWDYPPRTRQNIVESDGTVIFTVGDPTPGTRLTEKLCKELAKPYMIVDLAPTLANFREDTVGMIVDFADAYQIKTLNVAGPRESKVPGIQTVVAGYLAEVLAEFGVGA